MSTLRATDACSDIVLDFIAGGIPDNRGGESGGNYNAVINHIKGLPGVDLSKMTITQVYALEAQLVHSEPSSAVGRYQDIKATLQSLVAKQGVNPNTTLLTDLEQDELNVELLNAACRYQDWRAGKVADATFEHLISCQWASLPDPQNGGKSHYDGVGPNHAGTSLAAVSAMLVRAKAALRGGVIAGPVIPDTNAIPQQPIAVPAPQPKQPGPVPTHAAKPQPVSDDDTAEELTREANPGVAFNE